MAAATLIVAALVRPGAVRAADPEGCLSCHRYRGLARIGEDDSIRLFYIDPTYHERRLGPHAQISCTQCHERQEVEVIPHQPVTPVNCTRACHLAPAGQVEVRFDHSGIEAALQDSVHSQEVLAEANRLLGSPLSEGQAQCLLCHDEPAFRYPGETWAAHEAPIHRCDTCHTERLPKDTRYYYWHVFARSRPARPPRDLVRSCATCHSHPAILEQTGMLDATGTYLASFHGKAMLLGSRSTAVCLDCHVSDLGNAHRMMSHTEEGSPTSPERLPDTCRSAACHPTAGHGVSTAAVHLQLSAGGGIEYAIAVVFIVLIVATFGPSVVLTALEMLQFVVGRQDPSHARHARLAEELARRPETRRMLVRFTPHQRVQHWILVVCFTLLVLTGFPIKFADRAWAGWLIDLLGGLSLARRLHRWAGAVLILGFLYHVVYVGVTAWQRKRRTGQGWMRIFATLPMVMNPGDWRHMGQLLAYLLFLRKTRPEAGWFTLEEKFEYFGVFWGTILLGATGLLMWFHVWTTEHLTGRVLTIALLVHTMEAFLALLHVGIIHMVGVIFAPPVFPLSPAMFTGLTPPEEMAEGHAAMLENVARRIQAGPAPEVSHD